MTQLVAELTATDRWERRTEWPLTGAAVLFLASYAVPILAPEAPEAPEAVLHASRILSLLTWRSSRSTS